MTERDYLEKVCGVSKLTEVFKDIPFTKKHFTDRITVSYDAAKGFVVAQQEMAKMVDSYPPFLPFPAGQPQTL